VTRVVVVDIVTELVLVRPLLLVVELNVLLVKKIKHAILNNVLLLDALLVSGRITSIYGETS
jgi:hypothetical protein